MAGVDRLTDVVGKLVADMLGQDADCRLVAGVDRLADGVGWHLGEEELLRKHGQEKYHFQDHQILQVQDVSLVGWVDQDWCCQVGLQLGVVAGLKEGQDHVLQ